MIISTRTYETQNGIKFVCFFLRGNVMRDKEDLLNFNFIAIHIFFYEGHFSVCKHREKSGAENLFSRKGL